jgi:23S rRNA A1618 N6-methylase RlmF
MSQSENSDEVKKKRKKKLTVWEEKMAEMEAIQSMIDDTQVEEQERGIIREFFDNMSKLKKLRQQLKQLKEQKDYYKKLLAQEKNRPQSGS